ncbi:MAG: ribonuclease III [bacterium]|nr:ribonuclease III [bacterium]
MPDEHDFERLEKAIRYCFGEREILVQALSHSSYVHEHPSKGLHDNERLEFLGDSVLGIVITRYLFDRYPRCAEGELTLMRSVLVSEPALATVAARINLGDCLYLGKGEASTGGRKRKSNLANALEALIAAVYLDGGMEVAGRTVRGLFRDALKKIEAERHSLNYKNLLQHHCQEGKRGMPRYVLVSSKGPQHAKVFSVDVRIGGETAGAGTGRNKKQAEQEAARDALEALGVIDRRDA